MPRNMRIRKKGGRKHKIKVRWLVAAVALVAATAAPVVRVGAESCPDVRFVFARGSGGERWEDQNYLEFKRTIETKLQTVALSYEFVDLDYPAIGIGVDKLGVTLGALFGAGDAYEFGSSVDTGVKNLTALVNGASCPGTRYVLGGYSQGAMVVSKALGSLNAERVIYAATFGDPKIYLPEGKGLMPAACRGENLSDYRMYVPDCRAYKGMLGAYVPYEPAALEGKVGVWCNNRDIFCSSRHYNLGDIMDHISYVSDNLYEDASRVIFDKVTKAFEVENRVSSPHDTAILIDSTGSMASMIDSYKAEARRLAEETLAAGGRVALYDYRDLGDPYEPVEHCNFDTCTLESFATGLEEIWADGGGDAKESLLSASFTVMRSLKWKLGSTKSLVVLTDDGFLSPDRDGMTFDEVVKLSKSIDPVNFYIITEEASAAEYQELAAATDGLVVTNLGELGLLTDYIMERYDSLPRVEESDLAVELPTLAVEEVRQNSPTEVTIQYETDGEQVIVVLNDAILGVTEGGSVTITGLDPEVENVVTLVPIGGGLRGDPTEVTVTNGRGGLGDSSADRSAEVFLPKAPDTGKK